MKAFQQLAFQNLDLQRIDFYLNPEDVRGGWNCGVNLVSSNACITKLWLLYGSARSGSTYLLEADQATGSSYLRADISCVHCTSVRQSHPTPKGYKLLDTSPSTLLSTRCSFDSWVSLDLQAKFPTWLTSPLLSSSPSSESAVPPAKPLALSARESSVGKTLPSSTSSESTSQR